jgi:hypothetical protein
VAGKVLRVSLADYPDPETRERLVAIRTGLTLPREQVDAGGRRQDDDRPIAAFLEPGPRAVVMARRR